MPQILAASSLPGQVLPWVGLLLAIVVIGTIVIAVVRRSIHGEGRDEAIPFTLQDLRDLHASGRLTDEEFARAKARMLAAAGGVGGSEGVPRTEDSTEPGAEAPPATEDPSADDAERA